MCADLVSQNESSENEFVLVVEDNQDLNLAICEILASHRYRVESAVNGKEALERIKHARPDVILCDIMMPKMDGYTLLKHTRANPDLRTLPFIFLTARTSQADQREALTIGIEDYLTKPVDEQDLVLAIQNALRRHTLMEQEMHKQMDALRAQIVGILQHEFRTPLTFVLGYAEYIQDILRGSTDPDNIGSYIEPDELQTAIKGILEGGYRLQRLIEGFLLLAELQNRSVSENMAHLQATTLLGEISQEMQAQCTEANLDLLVKFPDDEIWLTCERDLITESLKRLIDNSIRYRRPESTTISLTILNPKGPYVGISVEDDGMGIPVATIERLSRPFEQGDRSDRTEPGAGLSLAMIQHIAMLHGGKLEIDSVEGLKTTATLWISADIDQNES